MIRVKQYSGQIDPAVAVGDVVTLGGLRFVVLARRELPFDRWGNVADLELRLESGRVLYRGGVKQNGHAWACR